MKTAITLFLGLAISGLVYSQNYHSLVKENNVWNVLQITQQETGNPEDTVYWTESYKILGDTVISEQVYKKVYFSEEEIPTNCVYEGGIREEDEKVWYFPKYGNGEIMMYDYTVSVGDTVEYLQAIMVVDSIASHEISEVERKHIYFSYVDFSPHTELWIEGIGSNLGLFSSGSATNTGERTWLLCMSEDEELIYMNPNYNSCHLVNTNIEEVNNLLIEVYPNPTQGKIKIKNTEYIRIKSITINDLRGIKLKEFNKNKTEIDLSGVSSGIYLLMVICENGEIIRKIVIE